MAANGNENAFGVLTFHLPIKQRLISGKKVFYANHEKKKFLKANYCQGNKIDIVRTLTLSLLMSYIYIYK
jgi:hypothetical protein